MHRCFIYCWAQAKCIYQRCITIKSIKHTGLQAVENTTKTLYNNKKTWNFSLPMLLFLFKKQTGKSLIINHASKTNIQLKQRWSIAQPRLVLFNNIKPSCCCFVVWNIYKCPWNRSIKQNLSIYLYNMDLII